MSCVAPMIMCRGRTFYILPVLCFPMHTSFHFEGPLLMHAFLFTSDFPQSLYLPCILSFASLSHMHILPCLMPSPCAFLTVCSVETQHVASHLSLPLHACHMPALPAHTHALCARTSTPALPCLPAALRACLPACLACICHLPARTLCAPACLPAPLPLCLWEIIL